MKHWNRILLIFLVFVSCKPEIKPQQLQLLNGYWEIEKVVFEEGSDKFYTMNETYDYFEINKENKGFRKKVKPQLNGTFLVNDTYENIQIQNLSNTYFIAYETPYAKWKEEIVSISKDKLLLKNDENTTYHYKKAAPITILNHGKKSK
jgi:hypothetical protein